MFSFLQNLFEPKSNLIEAAKLLFDELNVKITISTLTKEIQEHPDYPSLVSVSDILTNYGIDNLSMKIDAERLDQLPLPFFAPIKGEKSSTNFFTVVREVKDSSIFFYDPEMHKWKHVSKDLFLDRFLGIVLLTDAEEFTLAGEKDYDIKLKEEKRKTLIQQVIAMSIPLIVIIAGIMAFMQKGRLALLPFIFTIIVLIGAIIGVLLIWYELDQYNPLLQQICSAGKKVNCGAVLQSKASKIVGISWSTIGFTYFMGQLILLLLSGIISPQILFSISWLNALAVPYVFFSIYYQWKVAKQWCVLCLCVQILLILQLFVALIGNWHSLLSMSSITSNLILAIMTAFVVPFIAVTLLIPVLQKVKESKDNKNELQRLKHNPEIFDALLAKQKTVSMPTEGLGITLGNPAAKYKLIKVCNPYCGPCSKAHQPMEDLLENNPDVQIQIIFTAYDNQFDFAAKPVRHLLAIQETQNENTVKQALDDWYLADKKDYEAFSTKYPMNGEIEAQSWKVKAMRNWCDKMEIAFTPTFFISLPSLSRENGLLKFYQLPQMYTVHDLKYFLTV